MVKFPFSSVFLGDQSASLADIHLQLCLLPFQSSFSTLSFFVYVRLLSLTLPARIRGIGGKKPSGDLVSHTKEKKELVLVSISIKDCVNHVFALVQMSDKIF